jgi:hypothetical protein
MIEFCNWAGLSKTFKKLSQENSISKGVMPNKKRIDKVEDGPSHTLH